MNQHAKKTCTAVLAILLLACMTSGCTPKKTKPPLSSASTGSQVDSLASEGSSVSQADSSGSATLPSSAASSKNTATSTGTASKAPEAPTVETPAFSAENKENMGGYQMTIATLWPGQWEPSEKDNTAAVRQFNTALKKVETDYNAKITIKAVSDANILDDITKATAAGDLYADVIEIAPKIYYNLVIQNMLTPVNDLSNLNYNDSGWVNTYKNMTTYKGKFYGVTWISKSFGPPLRKAMFFNKDMLSKYNEPNPYEMVRKGTWTWENWEKILSDVKSKSSNSLYGVGAYDYASLSLAAVCSNNAAMYAESNGKYTYTGNSDNAVEAMDFIQNIVKEGLYAPAQTGYWIDTSLKDFIDGKDVCYVHDYYAIVNIQESMKQKYGVVPFPKGPQASGYTSNYDEGKFVSFMAGNPNVQKAAKLIFAIAKRTNDPKWVDTQVDSYLCDKDSGEMLKYLINGPAVDCTPIIPQFGVTVLGTLNNIATGQVSAKAGLQNVQITAQANLNDFFKQK